MENIDHSESEHCKDEKKKTDVIFVNADDHGKAGAEDEVPWRMYTSGVLKVGVGRPDRFSVRIAAAGEDRGLMSNELPN